MATKTKKKAKGKDPSMKVSDLRPSKNPKGGRGNKTNLGFLKYK